MLVGSRNFETRLLFTVLGPDPSSLQHLGRQEALGAVGVVHAPLLEGAELKMQITRYSKGHLSAGKRLSCICKKHTFNTKTILPEDARGATVLLFWYSSLVFYPYTRKGNTYLRIFKEICGIWSLIISLIRVESLHELLVEEW